MRAAAEKAPDYAGHSGAHTPGPWRHDLNGEGDMSIAAGAIDENGYPEKWIVGGCGCCGSPHGVDDPTEAKANANLIAAAPDMLAALQWIAGCEPRLTHPANMVAVAKDALDRIRAAEGEVSP